MKKVFLHIGYPKTATTLIQKNIFSKLSSVEYFGKDSPKYITLYKKFYNYIFYFNDSNYEEIKLFFLSIIEAKDILISEEDFLFNSIRFSKKINNCNYMHTLNRLKKLFSSQVDIKIFLTTRNIIDLVKSIYSQSYTNYFSQCNQTKTFEIFINNLIKQKEHDNLNINWYNTVKTLDSVEVLRVLKINFNNNVVVNQFSEFIENPKSFVLNFFGSNFYSNDEIMFISNYNFTNKVNQRSGHNKNEYSTNNNMLANQLALIFKIKHLSKLSILFPKLANFIKKIRIYKSNKLTLILSQRQESQLKRKFPCNKI